MRYYKFIFACIVQITLYTALVSADEPVLVPYVTKPYYLNRSHKNSVISYFIKVHKNYFVDLICFRHSNEGEEAELVTQTRRGSLRYNIRHLSSCAFFLGKQLYESITNLC